jgi:hypothetical protein
VSDEETIYFTVRHLLEALQALDKSLLDLPLVLVHGKELHKPNLVSGFIPAPLDVGREIVETKKPALLTLAALLDPPPDTNGRKKKAKSKKTRKGKKPLAN